MKILEIEHKSKISEVKSVVSSAWLLSGSWLQRIFKISGMQKKVTQSQSIKAVVTDFHFPLHKDFALFLDRGC